MLTSISTLTNRSALSLAVALALPAAGTASADPDFPAFIDPTFHGQANTTYQEWRGFDSAEGPNAPIASDNPNPGQLNVFDTTSATDGVFLIGGPGGHLYSFSGSVNFQVDVPNFGLGDGYSTEVVLRISASGNPLDPAAFFLSAPGGSPILADPVVPHATPILGGMGGESYNYMVTWNVAGDTLTFTPNDFSSSQAGLRVDTFATLAPAVPEPAAIVSASFGTAMLAGWGLRRRRRSPAWLPPHTPVGRDGTPAGESGRRSYRRLRDHSPAACL